MPILSLMIDRANDQFRQTNISTVEASHLAEGTSLRDLATNLGIAVTEAEKDQLDEWPHALQQVIRSALRSAADRDVPLTVSWSPAYDYRVRIWEAHSTSSSDAQITLHLSGPYPE